MSPSPITVIVTGANRGLGYEIVRILAQHPPLKPIQILACARKPPSKDSFPSHAEAKVQWCALDIRDTQSIQEFSKTVQKYCPDGVDVLINNSGVNLDITSKHGMGPATDTIEVNYDGTLNMMKTFLPFMRRPAHKALGHSRIVNVSSVGSKLSNIPSKTLRTSFRDASSLEDAQRLRDAYLSAVSHGTESQDGWPKSKSYSVSKALINASTQVLAAENSDLLINACCPGWCQTDMGSLVGQPTKSAADGAKIPLKLAFGNITESGKYWENSSVFGTDDGHISEWYIEGGS